MKTIKLVLLWSAGLILGANCLGALIGIVKASSEGSATWLLVGLVLAATCAVLDKFTRKRR